MARSNYPNNFDGSKFRFALAASGREGIAEAAGLSTLPEVFAGVEDRGTAWDEFNSEFLKLQAAEERAMEEADAREEAAQIAYEQAKENNEELREQSSEDRERSNWGTFGKTALTAAGIAASVLIPSDERTKNTIEKLDDACKLLRQLQPVTFYYNEEFSERPERMHYGFIAQQYAHVMPDHTFYDESIDKLCIDTSELIAVLVRGYQQLENRIQQLELSHTILGDK